MGPVALKPDYTVDLERAKALLREAGHPNGFKATAKVSPQYPLDVADCQIIKSQLQQIGIELDIQLVEWGQFLKEWLGGNYDTVCLTSGPLADPDGYTYDYFHSKSPRNRSKLFTGELDDIVTQARQTMEPAKRREAAGRGAAAGLELAPVIYLYSANGFEVHRTPVKGYKPNRVSRYGLARPGSTSDPGRRRAVLIPPAGAVSPIPRAEVVGSRCSGSWASGSSSSSPCSSASRCCRSCSST